MKPQKEDGWGKSTLMVRCVPIHLFISKHSNFTVTQETRKNKTTMKHQKEKGILVTEKYTGLFTSKNTVLTKQ